MEIVSSGTGAGSGALDLPFQRRNVEEWSRMDRVTGILEHARVETDHWAANTSHSSHKYGKVVDSRARNLADGSVQQRQRKQLEVFQAQVPGGSLQVIRTQSVTTSTTHNDFENLQLALNPLDLSSQKTKASVGRSGSIGARRPPSRPRSLVGKAENSIFEDDKDEVDLRLSEVARICQQVHEKAKKELISPSFHRNEDNKSESSSSDDIRKITAEKVKEYERVPTDKTRDLKSTVQKNPEKISNGYFHVNISRKKSCSTEDLQENDDETDDEVWKRTSKVRRSLQFPASKNINFEVIPTGNVSKLRKELEEGKHFHATRDISATDTPDNDMNEGASFKDKSRESEGHPKETRNATNKRHSFVTVESLKEVRGRLRRLNSSPVSIESSVNEAKIEDVDDGIATEEFNSRSSKMRPYVYGANTVASQKFLGLGTGSLESRISSRATNAGNTRSEEWYNRRKSYGFEPVHQEVNGDSLEKTNGESSTDSGICRSSETFGSSSWSRLLHKDNKLFDAHLNTSHTIHIKNLDTAGTKKSAKLRGTVVTLGSSNESSPQPEESKTREENCHLIVNDFAVSKKSCPPSEPTTITIPILPESDSKSFHAAPKSLAERRELLLRHSLWMNNAEVKRHSIAVDETKYVRGEVKKHSNSIHNNETRRHSYFENNNGTQFHHSLPGTVNFKNDDLQEKKDQTVTTPGANYSTVALAESEESGGKRHKRVEFCKTEVHFAAEPGRFNIVETDEKPPPTNMFRRRRKTNTTPQVQAGLPEIRFGDSIYEKKLLSGTETSVHQIEINLNSPKLCTLEVKEDENVLPVTREAFQDDADREDIVSTQANATIFASSANIDKNEPEAVNDADMQNYLSKDQSAIKPRSILKNNRKLRQFHLGELDHADVEESESKWGVRLKPVESSNTSPTMWRSSVALQSSGNVSSEEKSFSSESELQKLLRSLRPATERTDYPKTVPGVEVKVVTGGTAWSVANRVKQAEDQKHVENKGYSTRVNFGAGETKVVTKEQQLRQETKHLSPPVYQQNDSPKPIWLRREERKHLDVKTSSDKAYIVHIGEKAKENQSSQSSTSPKKTTMITIDLSPTCSNAEESALLHNGVQEAEKKLQNSSGSLLSPSLIMKTIHSPKRAQHETEPKTENSYGSIKKKTIQESEGKLDVPNVWNKSESQDSVVKGQAVTSQLAALRELYYNMELSDDSEKADEEVCSYMNVPDKHEKKSEGKEKDNEDNSSVVSGSWSRMRAFRNINRFSNKKETSVFTDDTANAEPSIKTTATAKLDSYGNSGRLQAVETLVSTRSGHPKITSISLHYEGDSREPTNGFADKQLHSEEAKSPSLLDKRTYENVKPKFSSETKVNEEPLSSYRKMKPLERRYSLEKSECEESCIAVHRPQITTGNVPYQQKTAVNSNTYTKSNNKRLSLQNQTVPSSEVNSEHSTRKSRLDYKEERKSERSNTIAEKNIYNKAPVCSKSRHVSLEKLLKESNLEEHTTKNYHLHGKEKTVHRRNERSVSPSKRSSPRTSTASENKSVSSSEMPIYQNLEIFSKRGVQRSDTESTIIEELTRAADEILQAVNGFTDEDSYKASTSDNDDEGRYQKGRKINKANLGTISEMPLQSPRRTGKKENNTAKVQQVITKRQVRQTSSTSSIESLTKRLQEPSKKKGTNGLGNRTSNRTARLLQRASSRELLLHASSSEDVASGAESHKPRLPRRSKTSSNKTDGSSATKALKKSSTAQQKDSIEKIHGMRRKEVIDVNKPKERLPGSTNKHSPSAWKSSSTVTAATSRTSNIRDEDRHRKDTSKLSTKTRSPRHKAEGPSRAPRTESREKSSEHHRVRNGGHSLSSACVVTKKKPNLVASHKEGDIQAVSKKMSH